MSNVPSSDSPPHADFITSQLPAELIRSPEPIRKAFRDTLIKSNQSRHDLQAFLQRLENPEAFARPRLKEALKRKFYGLLDDEKSLLVREWKHHHLLGLIKNHAQTTEHSLLEAALQNFEAEEAEDGGMEKGSRLYTLIHGRRDPNPIRPTELAAFCRDLDIGRHYQAHLEQVLGPTYSLSMTTRVQKLFVEHEKNALAVELHLAFVRKTLKQPQYEQLLVLARDGKHPSITCSHLTLDAVILPNVLAIQFPANAKEYILYTPQDPVAPLRIHPSLVDLESKLAERLDTSPGYREFFKRLVPLQHRETLLKIKPAWAEWNWAGTSFTNVPISLQATVTCTLIQVHAFLAVTRHRINQIKTDARTLAVPTEDADLLSRQKRLQSYLDIGKSLLFFAASFAPVVGEVLMIVSAAQLIGTVYNGFAAWSRGDSDEALNDLLDVLDTAAQVVVTAGAVRTVGFTAGLIKVRLRQGGERLWKPDLAPYRHLKKALPDGVPANAKGLYTHEQQHYLKFDEDLHSAKQDPQTQQWQLQHPSDPQAYTPQLLSNGVGGWRLAHETSQDWNNLKLIKRLGPDATNIREPQVETILQVSGVDSTALRQVHEEVLRPPPLLRDTVRRFNLDQEINDFDAVRAEGATVTPYSPYIQLHLTCSLPEWPANRTVKIIGEQGTTLLSHGTGNAGLEVPLARFRKGELLHCLEDQLPSSEFNELLPTPYADHLSLVENLAQRLAESTRQHRQRLFAWLTLTLDKPTSAVEQQIAQIAPDLSKSHVEEMAAVLSPESRSRLLKEKSLTAEQHWEADQYAQQARAARARDSLHLESGATEDTPAMLLSTLEHMPGWPTALRIEVRDQNVTGQLLGSTGAENVSPRYVVTREGAQFHLRNAQGRSLHGPSNLLNAITQTLTTSQLDAVLRPSGATGLREAMRKISLQIMHKKPPIRRTTLSRSASFPTRHTLDPLFAEPVPPEGLSLRADGIYQAPALPDGSYRYYALDAGKYYRMRADNQGWRLIDARSPFRAYQPYVRKRVEGGWELDEPFFEHPGGNARDRLDSSTSEEFVSAESGSDYESAPEGSTVYTSAELSHMRSNKSYQDNQNYRGVFNRANNGRYPLRDTEGKPMRIRLMQSVGSSHRHNETLSKALVMPYVEWEGFEKVAALYDDKLAVTPFTAAHQKFPEETSLIGQSTVVTTRAIRKGEVLGVYGGELLPAVIAANRRDPYLLDVFVRLRPEDRKAGASQPKQISPYLVLSGDNVLSRINTLFEYEMGKPVRQAQTGYNVIDAGFRVDTQVNDKPPVRLLLSAFFANEDLAPGTELRWNYGYDEATVRKQFGQPD